MDVEKNELDELKKVTNIHDFNKLSAEDITRIDKMAAEGKLSPKQMELLIGAIPNFIELQKTTIQALQEAIGSVREIQKDALNSMYSIVKSLDSIVRIFEQLAGNMQTDEAKMQIANHSIEIGRLGLEMAKIIDSMNKDNNNLWKYITAGTVLAGSALLVYIIFAGRDGSGGE